MMLLLAQTCATGFLALWLTTGVWENLRHPQLNSAFTAEVLSMSRMREAYPQDYARVAHRRIDSPAMQTLLFRLIVGWECLALLALWIGTGAMAAALIGATPPDTARALALLGALLFSATWAGFLIAGNWFCYWFCHEGAQNTHFQMTLWGTATMVLLAI